MVRNVQKTLYSTILMNNKNNIEIYYYYLGEPIFPGKKYYSPFREDKVFPALAFKFINETLTWKDFGGIQMNPHILGTRDGLAFIMQKENLSSRIAAMKFYENNIKGKKVPKKIYEIEKIEKLSPIVKIRTDWKDFELDYWKFIDTSLLLKNNIFPNELYDSGYIQLTSTPESPSFVYVFSTEFNSWKIYTPKDSKNKFKSNNVSSVIEGYEQLPISNDNLMIASSTKDRLTYLTYLNSKYSAINPHSENAYKNIIKKSHELNARFKNIFVSLDCDKTGHMQTKRICDITGWKPIYYPKWWIDIEMKDQSDIVINYGPGVFTEINRKFKLI